MASYLGIDIGTTSVRAVLVRTSYRKVTLAGVGAAEIAGVTPAEALSAAIAGLAPKADGLAVAIPGDEIFVRRLAIPRAAQRQLAEVVPFEIEAQIPFDIADAVFDTRLLPTGADPKTLDVLAVVARTADVERRIAALREVGAPEPELVAPGSFALAALVPHVPELAARGTFVLLDLGASTTEAVIVSGGEALSARTLSVGVRGLPASAATLARELRQTFTAFRAQGGAAIEAAYLVGGGAAVSGAEAFLAGELGIPVGPLPLPRLEGIDPAGAQNLARASKALALALSLAAGPKATNLRRGPLAFERGFAFLREKVPLLVGLGAVIVVSALFSTWAELRALSREEAVLEDALASVTKDVLGQELRDPSRALELVGGGAGAKDEDPLPHVDAFDVMAQLAEALPHDLKHDVDELDVSRASQNAAPHVSVHGVIPKVTDAEELASKLKDFKCFTDVKIVKTTQQVGGEAQKYHMEWELRCPSPQDHAKPAGSAQPATSGKP
ncbi:MAG: pilus assembly protein PilM [Polyangiaceae bacterium]|nr:pilus assembly protein PilM [Polyangiaceae bacterium]